MSVFGCLKCYTITAYVFDPSIADRSIDLTARFSSFTPSWTLGHSVMEKYLKLDKIGEGTYGVVYKGQLRANRNEFVAIKRIRMDPENEGVPSTAMREIAILKELNHPNIVSLKDVIIARNKRHELQLHLIFEYIDMDLRMFMDKVHVDSRKMLLPMVKSFTHQLLKGLSYIHVRRMLHRDLKPQNILVHSNGLVKLADFGLARTFSLPGRVYTHEVVTLWYRPPEILMGGNYYTTAVDIWSLACIVSEMINGEPIMKGDSEIDQLFRIFRLFGTPSEETWKGFEHLECFNAEFPKWPTRTVGELFPHLDANGIGFLTLMFVMNPKNRSAARYCLGHEFLNSGDFEAQYDVRQYLISLDPKKA
uniref:cyclin-dependent kinase n=1 Tax=Steinernema glaseri TaxID=37863 RepID=A0A1I7ZG02_9BILA